MTITSIQKLISIGSSEGVTIPKKDLAALGAVKGDELQITASLIKKTPESKQAKLMDEYDAFIRQYGDTLKNLANR